MGWTTSRSDLQVLERRDTSIWPRYHWLHPGRRPTHSEHGYGRCPGIQAGHKKEQMCWISSTGKSVMPQRGLVVAMTA
jgi:hypothetical protein